MGKEADWWKDPMLVTILVAIVTAGWVVSERIGRAEANMSERIGGVEANMSERIGGVEARLTGVEAKLDLLLLGLDIRVEPKRGGG